MRGSRRTQTVFLLGLAVILVVGLIATVFSVLGTRQNEPAKPTDVAVAQPIAPAKVVADTAKPTPTPQPPEPVDLAKAKPADITKPTTVPAPVARVARPEDNRPRVWSIVIGIDGYNDNESIPICRGSEIAAQAFSNWLKRQAAWEDDNVLQLSDRGQRVPLDPQQISPILYPSKANLEWAFARWLPARIRTGDMVVVFFAGQAIALPPAPGSVAGAAGRGMLLAIDSTAVSADLTGFSLENAIDDVAKLGRNQVICLLDTSLHGRGSPVKSKLAAKPDTAGYLRSLTRWPGVSAWIAATDKPSVQARTTTELSPFVAVLIDAMGTRDEPYNLLSVVSRMRRDARTNSQGFRDLGSIDSRPTLWSSELRLGPPKPPELLLQTGHARSVNQIVFRADGSTFATAADDSTVRIWRAADRQLVRVLDRNLRGVTSLGISEPGAFLASGDASGGIYVWDFQKRAFVPKELLPEKDSFVVDLGFIPQSNRLISRDRLGSTWLTSLSDANTIPKRVGSQMTAVAIATAFGPVGFATVDQNGRLLRYGRDGVSRTGAIEATFKGVESRQLATDGTRVAVASRQNGLALWDESAQRMLDTIKVADRVDQVVLRGDRLAAISGSNLLIFTLKDGKLGSPATFNLPSTITDVCLSNTGRFVAARTQGSTFHGWILDDGGAHTPLAINGETGLVTAVAFSPDEQSLVLGNQDGGVRIWDLPNREPRAPIPARRGQITSMGVSNDGRYLIQVNADHVAQLWDLFEGRELTVLPRPETPGVTVPEGWLSGTISRDGKLMVMSTYPKGDLVVLDRDTARAKLLPAPATNPFVRPTVSEDSRDPFQGLFDRVRLVEGPGRKLVAACAYKGDLICVWDFLTGALLYTIRCDNRVTGFDLTADSTALASADEDGLIQLWDLSQPNPDAPGSPKRLAQFALTKAGNMATAVRFLPRVNPKDPLRLVSGARDGEVAVWQVGEDAPSRVLLASGSEVTCLTLTEDQSKLAAGFRDKTLRSWRILPTIAPQPFLEPSPNHDEQINTLIAWPGRGVVASGSDDTTIRLWNLDTRRLEGTLAAGNGASDWVAYAPNGRFDCAVGAERQLTWLQNNEVLPVEQFGEQLRLPGLLNLMSQGRQIDQAVAINVECPRLAIDPPPSIKADTGEATLAVRLSDPGLLDLRLYQDGIPVRDASEFQLAPDGKSGLIKVRLHNGTNKFYAMAGRPGTIDGRSNEVELRYDEPDPPGELHVLALGVGNYERADRRLKYAKSDAVDLASFLQKNGVRANTGLSIVLNDEEVQETAVTSRLVELRNRVRDRPQDTVAIFLAGHTDMVSDRFSLLLPKFLFSERGGVLNSKNTFIEFSTIYRYVTYLGCQNRLIIVDACRSGEILNDPRVKDIQRRFDSNAHKGKTSYILAARQGGVAGEADSLKHGLLTFALLKGMGAPGLNEVTFTDIFKTFPTADRDQNKVVTADELRWYADLTVPKLSRDVPLLVQRSGVSRTSATPNAPPPTTKAPEPPSPAAIPLVPVP